MQRDVMNPYKLLVEKYEKLLELKRSVAPKQAPFQAQSLHDEILNSSDFSSFNTKYTNDDEKKATTQRQKSSTDFETDTTSSGIFEEETSTKATQTEESQSLLFSIADGEACKFSLNMVYDETTPVERRFKDQPKYQELFKEIFSVLKKAADNKEEGEKLPLLDEEEKIEARGAGESSYGNDFDTQSVVSESVMSENSVISECVTKTERKKAKSHKKQAVKDDLDFGPPTAVKMVAGKLVTPYNRLALDLSTLAAKKKARRSNHRSKDKYAGGRDSSVCSNASSISNQASTSAGQSQNDNETEETSTLKRNKRGRRSRELLSYSTLGATEWNGDSVMVYSRNSKNPSNFYCRPGGQDNSGEIEFKTSAASHELKKLKKLDLSYAEVLRHADRSARHRKWK